MPPMLRRLFLIFHRATISLITFGTDRRFFLNKNPLVFEILRRNTLPLFKSCSECGELEIPIEADKRRLGTFCKADWTQFAQGYPR